MRNFIDAFLWMFAIIVCISLITCTTKHSNATDAECVGGFIWKPLIGYTGETCEINGRG